ncbi:Rmf/CrpP family protein [Methylobacterium sp. NEAU 140]|uniref:ribosome modulation factor n=1 Tax=Methylobacterium sp. NEAU 140 TaxID=3064945 RepID=UPI0027349AF1|nr:Rmf/CrpP family protein [Methylobacterium sp. NEAU 140]MDP4026119.1 Rmf/CrpP family protein [Methylobacterium sp. NEAU 140]
MDTRQPPSLELIAEGAHARTIVRPKDACPYPAGSPERVAWLEGYDGTPAEDGPDLPETDA